MSEFVYDPSSPIDKSEQWALWFNALPVVDQAKICGIEYDGDDETCTMTFVIVKSSEKVKGPVVQDRFMFHDPDNSEMI